MMDHAAILPSVSDAVIVLDASGVVEFWEGASSEIFGFSADEAKGKSVDQLLKVRDANGNEQCLGGSPEIKRLRIAKALPEREVLTTDKGGRDLWVGASGTFLRNSGGGLESVVVVARDIRRRKNIDLAKSEVISAVAHELRSPLTSVKGFTSTLLRRWDRMDDEMKKHLLLTINTDADRVTRLIGELLDISRLESGRLELKKQMVDLKELAERSMARVQVQAEDREIELVEWAPAIPETYADPDKIEQVLTNLLENAIKYGGEGTVRVSGALENEDIIIAVDDDGPGISEDDRGRIFDKFARSQTAKAGDPSGTGLGLYISRGIVRAHGGDISVGSSSMGGARFAFSIPVSQLD